MSFSSPETMGKKPDGAGFFFTSLGGTIMNSVERRKIEQRLEKVNEKQKIIIEHVKRWADFSLVPRTEDEIRGQVIKDKTAAPGEEVCCFSYICSKSKLSEEFIEELMELTKVKKQGTKNYTDRLDWTAICTNQTLSEEFIEKHAKQVDWRAVLSYQKLSDEFIEKHKKELGIFY